MITDVSDVINKIIFIPKVIKNDGASFETLMRKSGYLALFDEVSEQNISKALRRFPHNIKDWLNWSSVKKDLSGWYFIERGEGQYFVGHFPDHFKGPGRTFDDGIAACAHFIKSELEERRVSGKV